MRSRCNRRWFSALPLLALSALLLPALGAPAHADPTTDQMTQLAAQQSATVDLTSWRFHQPDSAGGENATLDDSGWQAVAPGFQWSGENTNVWFRTTYTVPASVNGIPTEGAALTLQVGMDDDVDVFVDGKFRDHSHWDDGHVLLAEHAKPGQTYQIALRGINGPGMGQLHYGRMVYDLLGPVQPRYGDYIRDAQFVGQLAGQMSNAADRAKLTATLMRSESALDLAAVRNHDWRKANAALESARKTLLEASAVTRQYDVYYVGHAHIDMNWLWPWTETIDVCHRTWDSAMNLMDKFPDFGFVQSQPGAYRAIQEQYPDEFARMQKEAGKGQWDTVSGFYDESDTNMPSGEALARSLFLGQRYFKTNFGHYAETGWLPDSFGHSWQVPQLLQGVGIQNYYHTRCGDGIRYAWWEAPDGSRVLKANTDSYDEPITPDQLLRPLANERQYGLKEALVVFGVGDHGGGPTRDMILAGQGFQSDPLFPKVHFATADAYFDHLHKVVDHLPDLPIVDTDLQYTFVGCYTTHADMKKAVRSTENNLYTAEVFSTLADMNAAQPYPVAAFEEAWRPSVFAQFHDIMCGSAIHSTYDWMHQQLAPAFAFEAKQTDHALASLTATVDTRAAKAGETPVVVWNALSQPRTDIVRITIDNARKFTGVRDAAGHFHFAQPLDDNTLMFVASGVPAFGHAVYYLTHDSIEVDKNPWVAIETPDTIRLQGIGGRVTIAKDTGAITSLIDNKTGQELIAPGQSANILQLLGDKGNAWDITYTGEQHDLTTGATVALLQNGPVYAVVRVVHTYNKSMFTQDVTFYRDIPRIDIPTTVEWHEHGQLLKVAFPLNMQHPQARVGIPYGSIERPTSGQENPGQKWMDVTETQQQPITHTTPLDLTGKYNHSSAADFDTQNRRYPADLMPSAGVHTYGPAAVPFTLAAPGEPDNIACDGQTVAVPAGVTDNTLYVLGAGAPSPQSGSITVLRADGSRGSAHVQLGDWVMGGASGNDRAFELAYRFETDGARDTHYRPGLWIAAVRLPASNSPVTQITLPRNPNLHIFALTLGASVEPTPRYGLTVLNDSKYGSDTNGGTFRLTLLRSSNDPDPNPDEGIQSFTYSLVPHGGDYREAASGGADEAGLALNIPLAAVVTDTHPGATTAAVPPLTIAPANVLVGALKHAEDTDGYTLRVYESQGRDTIASLDFGHAVHVEETDILERPIKKRRIDVDKNGHVTFPIGHNQIVTLHITGLPDAGLR